MSTLRSRASASLAAGAILFASTAVLGGSPAYAAAGDASAFGVSASVDVNLVGDPAVAVTGLVADVAAPPSDAQSTLGVILGVPGAAALSTGVINTSATSEAVGVDGEAEVAGVVLSVPVVDALIGGPILDTGTSVISASADCAPGVNPSTSFGETVDLRVAGGQITLDLDGETTVGILVGGLPVGTVTIRDDVSTTSTETAEATALIVTVDIDIIGIASVGGEVRIAEAACEKATPVVVDAPSISGLTPNTGPIAGGQLVTVTGTNFVAGDTTVIVDGVPVPDADVTVLGPTSLTYSTPAHAIGPVDVSVSNSGGSSGTLPYTYTDEVVIEAPSVSAINPTEGPTAGGQLITITGDNFVVGDTTVTIGGIVVPAAGVTVLSPTSLTFDSPPHAAGPVDVFVTTPGGDSGTLGYTYLVDGSAPNLVGLLPTQGPVEGGTIVTITGTDFVPGDTTITIGGVVIAAADVDVNGGGTTATFTTPAHAVGPVDVTATTPIGTSDALTFTYTNIGTPPIAPAITGIAPDQGPVAGGTVVVLTGTGFVPGETSITVDGTVIPAGSVAVNAGGTTATFTTPAHAVGPVEVTASTNGGTSAPVAFTYTDNGTNTGAPTAGTITPSTGPIEGGTTVTIDGTGFVPGQTTVSIGGVEVPAGEVTVNADGTSLTFDTPPHAAGPVQVIITTPNGSTGPLTFTYVDRGPGPDPIYRNCTEVFAAGLANLTPADPGYSSDLDGDADGVACESGNQGNPGGSGGGSGGPYADNFTSLPRTGSTTLPLVVGGVLSIVVGGAMLTARRRTV